MRSAVIILLLAGISGCNPQPRVENKTNLVLLPGIGITNVLAFGMSASEIKRAHPDAKLFYYPEAAWFRKTGIYSRLPWQPPERFTGFIPSLKARFEGGYGQGIGGGISFETGFASEMTSTNPAVVLNTGAGFSNLCGILRDDIIKWYGMPQEWIDMGCTNQRSWTSFATSGSPYGVRSRLLDGGVTELFYYPNPGVMFDVENDRVCRLVILQKLGPRMSCKPQPGAKAEGTQHDFGRTGQRTGFGDGGAAHRQGEAIGRKKR